MFGGQTTEPAAGHDKAEFDVNAVTLDYYRDPSRGSAELLDYRRFDCSHLAPCERKEGLAPIKDWDPVAVGKQIEGRGDPCVLRVRSEDALERVSHRHASQHTHH